MNGRGGQGPRLRYTHGARISISGTPILGRSGAKTTLAPPPMVVLGPRQCRRRLQEADAGTEEVRRRGGEGSTINMLQA